MINIDGKMIEVKFGDKTSRVYSGLVTGLVINTLLNEELIFEIQPFVFITTQNLVFETVIATSVR